MRYQIEIAYDGTSFGGWQTQKNSSCIQPLIEKALSTVLREPISIIGSSRTDAGVHAHGQSAHFDTEQLFIPTKLLFSINALLPGTIYVRCIQETSPAFHARYSALCKIYHYRLHLEKFHDPFKRLYSYHIPYCLNLDLLREGSHVFIGTHDFTSFANEAHQGAAANGAIRTIHRLDIAQEPGGIRLEFEGTGFLYKMVRNITGTLIDIARGKRPVGAVDTIFKARSRAYAGPSAPAHGLHLMKIEYAPQALQKMQSEALPLKSFPLYVDV